MTREQRRIVHVWIAAVFGLGTVAALDLLGFGSWVRPALVVLMIPMFAFDRPDPEGSTRWQRVANEHPFLKWWLAISALAIAVNAVIATHSDMRIFDAMGLSGIFGALAVAFGPLLAFVEYDKFKEAGGDAS